MCMIGLTDLASPSGKDKRYKLHEYLKTYLAHDDQFDIVIKQLV